MYYTLATHTVSHVDNYEGRISIKKGHRVAFDRKIQLSAKIAKIKEKQREI